MKLFIEVDVVVIVPALVLHYRASFSFCVFILMEVENNIVLDLNFQFAFILIDVGNHIVLYFYFLFVFLLETFK